MVKKKSKLIYEEMRNNKLQKITRITNVEETIESYNFSFLLEPKNILNIKYNKINNSLSIQREGQIRYNIKHIVKVKNMEEINVFESEQLNVEVMTREIKFKQNNNKVVLEVRYFLDDIEMKLKFTIEENNG